MNGSTIAFFAASGVALLGVTAAVGVLGREMTRRYGARRALERVAQARALVGGGEEGRFEEVVAGLRRFDDITIERALEALLAEEDPDRTKWAERLFERLGMLDRYTNRLRQARSWSERAHAAQVLGKVKSTGAVHALVETLRDAYEDVTVKAAAAQALAAIRDPAVVGLLVKELATVDEHATPRIAEALVGFGTDVTPHLLRLLEQHENAGARVWAARILGRVKDPNSVDALAARLRDRHDLLRVAVAEALGAIGDSRALQPLVQATLRDPASQVRAHGAAAVARIAGAGSADVLVAALADPDYTTRLRALEAFENIRLEDTSPLEQALGDTNVEVRRRAALALERVGYLDRIVAQLASDERSTVRRAHSVLLELGRAGLADSIAAHVHHESMAVRAGIAAVCGDLGVERVGPILIAALDDPDWPVRAALCEAIGKLRPVGGPQAMAELLSDPEESVNEAAAEALAAFTAQDIEPFSDRVASAYQGGSIPVRQAVISIAARIDNEQMTAILLLGVTDPSEGVRLRAVRSIAHRPPAIAVAPLIVALTDTSLEVRTAATTPLGESGNPEAFEALLRALPGAPEQMRERIAQALASASPENLLGRVEELAKGADLGVRLGIAWTLGKRGDDAGIRILASFLRDKEPRLRASAAGALGKIQSQKSVPVLLSAIADRDAKTRAAVVNAIGKRAAGVSTARTALEERLRDPDAFVRNRAIIALARVEPEAATAVVGSHHRRALLDDAAVIVALGLVGTDAAIADALAALMEPARLAGLKDYITREDPAIRTAFFRNLKLEDPGASEIESTLTPAALVVRYEQLLRSSQDVKERITAIEALARIRTERSAAILADALTADPAEPIRLRSAQALGHVVGDDVAREALIRAISDPSSDVAAEAIRALAGVRDVRVSAALFRRLGAGPQDLSEIAEQALADLHKDDLVPLLDRFMGVDRTHVLVAALGVLRRIGSPEALPLLRELLKSSEAAVRVGAVAAIGAVPTPEASSILASTLEDPHEQVRLAALDAFLREAPETVLARVAPARTDPSPLVRARLAERLTRYRGAGIRIIEGLLEDASPNVRAEALGSLLEMAESESLRRFVAAWARTGVEVRNLVRSISRAELIGGKLAHALRTHADPFVREAAIAGLQSLALTDGEERIEPALLDPKPNVRLAAILALAASGRPGIIARVTPLLHDPDSRVRDAARETVNRLG